MKKKRFSFKAILILLLVIFSLGLVYTIFNSTGVKDRYDWLTLKSSQKLDVPLENQYPDLPNGCEVTSLSTLLWC